MLGCRWNFSQKDRVHCFYSGRARGVRPIPFFCNYLCFCNHFEEELKTVLTQVKLIINNATNRLLFGRQLLCCSNTTSTVFRNLTVLSSTADKINHMSNHFWHRWRHEYVVNLCETTNIKIKYKLPKKLCSASLWWKGVQALSKNFYSNKGIT